MKSLAESQQVRERIARVFKSCIPESLVYLEQVLTNDNRAAFGFYKTLALSPSYLSAR